MVRNGSKWLLLKAKSQRNGSQVPCASARSQAEQRLQHCEHHGKYVAGAKEPMDQAGRDHEELEFKREEEAFPSLFHLFSLSNPN